MALNVDKSIKVMINGSAPLEEFIAELEKISKNSSVFQEIVILRASTAQTQRDESYVEFVIRDAK